MNTTNKIIVAIPHSHTWFWTQTCIACLKIYPPIADGYNVEVIVVDNSPWSPAIRGVTDTALGDGIQVVQNSKSNKFHASALDYIVENYEFDYLMAMETDALVLRPNWLQWFVDMMRPSDFAVGMWHHEKFVNPSCTLYHGHTLREMNWWCKHHPSPDTLRWGPLFGKTSPLDNNLPLSENPAAVLEDLKGWIAGPFAEKRGWSAGTDLLERPSGQDKGPGWYEPGQQLHHWAVNNFSWIGTYTVCPTLTTKRMDGLPLQSLYGAWGQPELNEMVLPAGRLADGPSGHDHMRALEAVELFGNAYAAHMWGGTRALDIVKHDVTCQFVKANTPFWLAREARYWRHVVPEDIQYETLKLIRKYGWHYTGQSNTVDGGNDRDRAAVEMIRMHYQDGGVEW